MMLSQRTSGLTLCCLALLVAACGDPQTTVTLGNDSTSVAPAGGANFADAAIIDVIPELAGAHPSDDSQNDVQCPRDWRPASAILHAVYSDVLDRRTADSPGSAREAVIEYFVGGVEPDPFVDQQRVRSLDSVLMSVEHISRSADELGYPVVGPTLARDVELPDGRTIDLRVERVVLPWNGSDPGGPLLLSASVVVLEGEVFSLEGMSYCEIVSVSEADILSVTKGVQLDPEEGQPQEDD